MPSRMMHDDRINESGTKTGSQLSCGTPVGGQK
jgi:hypothetical protein